MKIESGTWWGRPYKEGSSCLWAAIRLGNYEDAILVFSTDRPGEFQVVGEKWFDDLGLEQIPEADVTALMLRRFKDAARMTLEDHGVDCFGPFWENAVRM